MNKLVSLKLLAEKLQKPLSPSPISYHFYKPFKSKSPFLTPPHSQCHYSPKTHSLFSNPMLLKHFHSTAHPFTTFVGPKLLLLRSHFPKFKLFSSSPNRAWSSWSQGYSVDNLVLGLIVANAAVFVLWRVLDRDFMYKNFTISVDNIKSGRIHTMVTSAFSHIDMGHIASNMIGLYFFGNNIGRMFGPEYLLKLYIAGAVVGSIFYVVHHGFLVKFFQNQGTFYRDSSKIPGLGASGAVNAILLLDIFLFPKATLMLDFFIPVPAILLGIFLIGKDILRMMEGDQQISGSAHLGGAAVAAAAWLRIKGGRRFRF